MKSTLAAIAVFLAVQLAAQTYWCRDYIPFPEHPGDSADYSVEDVIVCADGGFAVTGTAYFTSQGNRGFIMKVDDVGELQWARLDSIPAFHRSTNMCAAQTLDGGFISYVRAYHPNYFLLKRNAHGDVEWTRRGGQYFFDTMDVLADGSIVCAGYTMLTWPYDSIVVKYTPTFEYDWAKTISANDSLDVDEEFVSLRVTNYPRPESGFLVVGQLGETEGAILARLHPNGVVDWITTIDSFPSCTVYDVCEGEDGEAFATVEYGLAGGVRQSSMEQFSFSGEYLGRFDIPVNTDDIWLMRNVLYDPLSNSIVGAGEAYGSPFLFLGDIKDFSDLGWSHQFSQVCLGEGDKCLQRTLDGGYVVAGTSYVDGRRLPMLIKTNDEGQVATDDESAPAPASMLSSFPNPFNPETTVRFELTQPGQATLEVFNIRGQRVATLADGHFDAGEHSIVWRADGLSSGVYFARLRSGDAVETTKLLLVK